ncbi:hypothetical protein [Streptomyces sp. NPDC088350]|uniref:hypothetical protein n=1 Tax=Streptomyces sp. NPDC088350 TaxID=3365854 RepID=UPI003803675B
MDQPALSWLLAQLGTSTDAADLEARYTRLRSARAVAMDNTNNLIGIERQITAVTAAVAPDDSTPADGIAVLVTAPPVLARRIR